VALIAMALAAALGGVASFFGLSGKWKRNPDPLQQLSMLAPSRHQ
jgi:hypothetical protein